MRISIDEDIFSFTVDFSRNDTIEDGFQKEYFPPVSEACEAFYRLLENCYPKAAILDYLRDGWRG